MDVRHHTAAESENNGDESMIKQNSDHKRGKVWLAGAGPGDEGLLTVRTAELIETADVIVYDALISPEILSRIPAEKACRKSSCAAGRDQSNPCAGGGEGQAGTAPEGRRSLRVRKRGRGAGSSPKGRDPI